MFDRTATMTVLALLTATAATAGTASTATAAPPSFFAPAQATGSLEVQLHPTNAVAPAPLCW